MALSPTVCPSRHASYYSAKVNGTLVKDIAWLVLLPPLRGPDSVVFSGFIPTPPPNSKLKADMRLIRCGSSASHFNHLNLFIVSLGSGPSYLGTRIGSRKQVVEICM